MIHRNVEETLNPVSYTHLPQGRVGHLFPRIPARRAHRQEARQGQLPRLADAEILRGFTRLGEQSALWMVRKEPHPFLMQELTLECDGLGIFIINDHMSLRMYHIRNLCRTCLLYTSWRLLLSGINKQYHPLRNKRHNDRS